MSSGYVARRIGIFFVVVWLAASLNFFLPHLAEVNPIRQRLTRIQAFGVASGVTATRSTGEEKSIFEQTVATWEKKFGLDQPLWKQYLRYLGDVSRFDLGFSIVNFPASVLKIVLQALPWTIMVIGLATIMSFALGTALGALMVWRSDSIFLNVLGPPILALSAIPYYLLGIGLVYLLAFTWAFFPISGGYAPGTIPDVSWGFVREAAHHAVLPALSIVVAQIGLWGLYMRGMMVTGQEEDFMHLAEAKGLKGRRLFLKYAVRNAILPQATNLALTLGLIITQGVLVEVVFSYPGIGSLLFSAIRTLDFFVINGIVFMVVLSVALSTLIIDLVNPILDPRIRYQQA